MSSQISSLSTRPSKQETQNFIGLSVTEVKGLYPHIRVAVVDNVPKCVTDDICLWRLNVSVEKNIVTQILGYY